MFFCSYGNCQRLRCVKANNTLQARHSSCTIPTSAATSLGSLAIRPSKYCIFRRPSRHSVNRSAITSLAFILLLPKVNNTTPINSQHSHQAISIEFYFNYQKHNHNGRQRQPRQLRQSPKGRGPEYRFEGRPDRCGEQRRESRSIFVRDQALTQSSSPQWTRTSKRTLLPWAARRPVVHSRRVPRRPRRLVARVVSRLRS